MFGFDFMENFRYPYIAKSVTEFWRRWHISLGDWFRVLFIYRLAVIGQGLETAPEFTGRMVLTGLWHGASWNFIVGLYFGFFVIIEKRFLLQSLGRLPAFVGHVYTLLVIMIGWVLFEMEQLASAWRFIGVMFGFGGHVFLISRRSTICLRMVYCLSYWPSVQLRFQERCYPA